VSLRDAYSATGVAWRDGPERVYQRLADVLVAASPLPLTGQRVADVGSGTGAASRSIAQAGMAQRAPDHVCGPEVSLSDVFAPQTLELGRASRGATTTVTQS
jgi:hypothetical protein